MAAAFCSSEVESENSEIFSKADDREHDTLMQPKLEGSAVIIRRVKLDIIKICVIFSKAGEGAPPLLSK